MARILIVTGEASGDLHGANLAREVLSLDPSAQLVGIGGAGMKAAGVALIPGVPQLDVMGLVGLSAVRAIVRRISAIRRVLRSERWDLVVLIDNPALNLHFARVAKAAGQKVLYYVAPQIWAWRPGRIKWIQRRVNHVVVILPFEEEIYRRAGIRCTYVGHPLLDAVAAHYDRSALRRRFGLDQEAPVIGLLPGSRVAEVELLMPVLLKAAAELVARNPKTQFILAQASSIRDELIRKQLHGSSTQVTVVRDQASEVMAASDILWIASGTATLQAAVVGTPMVLLYKTTLPTYLLARCLIRVKWIGLVNLIAGRSVIPELIQDDATAERLIRETDRLLNDRQAYGEMKDSLQQVHRTLGEPGASRRAAQVVLDECRV